MQLRTAVFVVAMSFILAGGLCLQGQEVLDLVKARQEHPPEEPKTTRVSGGLVSGEGMVLEALPLELTLVSITPKETPYGAEVFYQVKVKNVGTVPVPFPWSVEGREDAPEQLHAVLILVARDASGEEWTFAPEGIYGRAGVAGTIRNLPPGDEVMIRARGRVATVFSDKVSSLLASLPREFSVSARLRFMSGIASRNRVPILTGNSLPLKVLPPVR